MRTATDLLTILDPLKHDDPGTDSSETGTPQAEPEEVSGSLSILGN